MTALSAFQTSGAGAASQSTSDVACGSTSASWNVPNGGLVLLRSEGVVTPIFDATGEYRTHSMLSHGPGNVVSHSIMHSPGTTGWPAICGTPLRTSELMTGYPGPSRINQGAAYQSIYGGGSIQYIAYQRSRTQAGIDENGGIIADWLLDSMPSVAVSSQQDGGQALRRLLGPNGAPLNYVFYQYRNIESVNTGGAGWNNGMVCSTFIPHVQYRAGFEAVLPYTYNHSKLVSAGNALYSAVYSQCQSGLGFWTKVGASILCFDSTICDEAARQVRNCMVSGSCNTSSNSPWNSVAGNPDTVAISISPDRLGGWSGHPFTGAGVSVWAYDIGNAVQWNSPGNVYGCWF